MDLVLVMCKSLTNRLNLKFWFRQLVHAASGLTLEEPMTESLTGAIQKINVSLTWEREK